MHNVSWKVNVWTPSELSHLAEVCRVWCGRRWSEAHLDTPPFPSKDSPDTLSLVRAHVFLLLLWLCALQVEDTDDNFTKWQDQNNLTYTNKHTCHPRTASLWPCRHILLLSRANLLQNEFCLLCRLSPCFVYFVFFSLFLPPFPPSPPPLHHCCYCTCLQSQTATTGQSDVPLKPEEFTVGDSTGEKLIVFPGVQSTFSACHVNLSLPSSLPPSHPSQCEFPADFPLKHMLQLRVGCHLSL